MNLAAPVLLARLFDKMSLSVFFSSPLSCVAGGKNRGPGWSFAVFDRLITFFTLDAQLWDPLCEAEEAFLSFLSFKCRLASEWPTGLPSSTLHNLLSVCKVLRGTCQNLTRPQSGVVIVLFFPVFYQTCFFFLSLFLACFVSRKSYYIKWKLSTVIIPGKLVQDFPLLLYVTWNGSRVWWPYFTYPFCKESIQKLGSGETWELPLTHSSGATATVKGFLLVWGPMTGACPCYMASCDVLQHSFAKVSH